MCDLRDGWENGVWKNIFYNDNKINYNKNYGLFDEFCHYCGYKIVTQKDKYAIVKYKNMKAATNLKVRVRSKKNSIIVNYSVKKYNFINLDVIFTEKDSKLFINHKYNNISKILDVFYINIGDKFVSNGTNAIQKFMKNVDKLNHIKKSI